MTEYIHSGIAGKINRIVKPHIGNILVTSEFGNAKESTLTEDVLKTAVNDINRIKYAVTYKGEKATINALPTTGNTKGDMWNVTENGHNYAWTGSEWDDLGGESNNTSSSEWLWNPTPIYDEILTDGYYYDIEDDIPYELPSNIFGNGLENLLIFIEKDASTGTTAELVGSCYWSTSIPNLGGVITKYRQNTTNNVVKLSACFSITKEHGQYIGKAFSRLRQRATVLEAIPDPSPIHIIYTDLTVSSAKITSFSLSESLPAGTHVTVYTAL